MLLLREQDFTASGHDTLDAKSLVMVTLRQATSIGARSQIRLCHGMRGWRGNEGSFAGILERRQIRTEL